MVLLNSSWDNNNNQISLAVALLSHDFRSTDGSLCFLHVHIHASVYSKCYCEISDILCINGFSTPDLSLEHLET